MTSLNHEGIVMPLHVNYARDTFTIIDGHRRYYAARRPGWDSLPCVVHENLDPGALCVSPMGPQRELEGMDALRERRVLQRSPRAVWSCLRRGRSGVLWAAIHGFDSASLKAS